MPQKTKNQHYVPRTYLKHFATADSSDDKPCVNAYMKEEGKQLNNQSISEVASAKWFYDFPGDENQTVENHLSKLEDRVGPILDELSISANISNLSYSDMYDLAFFLATQHYRTRKFRDMQTESIDALLDAAKNHPEHFEEFIKENSQYTAPDIERMLSEERIAIASRRLVALQLPREEQVQRIAELDEELRQFNERSKEVKRFIDNYKQGKVSDEFLQIVKTLSENPEIKQAQSLQASVPKLAQRLLSLEWIVHKYSQDANLFTSDNPFMFVPLARPANEDDWEADGLYSMTCLGIIHFYTDEIIEDYPPMAFTLPLTPHLRLVIAPPGAMRTNGAILDQQDADIWNIFQVAQAHRFIFSAQDDFSAVPKAVESYLKHKRFIDEILPALMAEKPNAFKREPRHRRWVKF